MKIKKYIAASSLLALLALGSTGCSSEEIINNGTGTEVPAAGKSELVFNFGGLKLKTPGTRAESIATEDETMVENLVIILAGVDDETHTTGGAGIVYEYRSIWATPPVETDNYKQLTLTQTGNVLTGKLLVDEAVMLPSYLAKKALVLVNGISVNLTNDDGSLTVLTNGEALSKLTYTDLYQFCGGKVQGTDLAAGGRSIELTWGPANLTAESIECPLPMTSFIESINFHGSTNLNVTLTRCVSRFDLRNGQSAQLRIGSIRPLDATTGIEFDEATDTRVDMMEQSFLPLVPDADWANVPAEVVPAFYTFPSALNVNKQHMKFRVTAKKLNGATGMWEDKTYTLNLEDANKKPISIDRNTRYVINIAEVTDLHITATITIADWQQGGDVDGDLNPSTASRKTPKINDVANDDTQGIAWTTDPTGGVPTALNLSKAYDGQTVAFSTPAAAPIDPADPDADQPEVSIDIFKEAGESSPGSVWLTATKSAVTRAAAGNNLFTLTVTVPEGGNFVPLYVKVKNHYYPEQFVMFRVTGMAGDKIILDPSDGLTVPDGWKQDPDTDVFEEGTVEGGPLYNGQPSELLAVAGCTPYWVAPVNAATNVAWTAIDFSTVCPEGWHVPSLNEFKAMGFVGNSQPQPELQTAISVAFPIGDYWSTEQENATRANYVRVTDNNVAVGGVEKDRLKNVRCVRRN